MEVKGGLLSAARPYGKTEKTLGTALAVFLAL